MSIIARLRQVGILTVLIAGSLYLACSDAPQAPTAVYRVRRLAPSQIINVDDHSLADWSDALAVLSIQPHEAHNRQWKTIRRRTPKPLSPNDLGLTVYMARDADYWYVAVEAADDHVLSGPSAYPYSGDCVEIFLAGKALESKRDFHEHVHTPQSAEQAAFLQIELPAGDMEAGWDAFPAWRTDPRFRQKALGAGFRASVWKTAVGWNAEARIPLAAFEPEVRRRIDQGEALKMNIDYLDYDTRTARRTSDDDWGFLPDNVFCLDAAEAHVHTPKYMRSVIFE